MAGDPPGLVDVGHRIEDGKIEVVRVINSCFYWVRCSRCPSIETIRNFLESCRPVRVQKLALGDKVVIKYFTEDKKRAVFHRAVVVKCLEANRLYHVFLPDVLLPDESSELMVPLKNIYAVDVARWDEISDGPHVIGLHGGVPILNNDETDKETESSVDDILRSSDSLRFAWVEVMQHQLRTYTFGNVWIVASNKEEHLLHRLVEKRFAMYQEQEYFDALEDEGVMPSVAQKIAAVELQLDPLRHKKQSKKVHKVLPPPPTVFDQDAFEKLKMLSPPRMEDQIIPRITTESHDEYNERMRRSALLNSDEQSPPQKCAGRGPLLLKPDGVGEAAEGKATLSKGSGRGELFKNVKKRTNAPIASSAAINGRGSQFDQESRGQFDDPSQAIGGSIGGKGGRSQLEDSPQSAQSGSKGNRGQREDSPQSAGAQICRGSHGQFDGADQCATPQRAAFTLKKDDPAILEIEPSKKLDIHTSSNGFGRGKLFFPPSQSVADEYCQLEDSFKSGPVRISSKENRGQFDHTSQAVGAQTDINGNCGQLEDSPQSDRVRFGSKGNHGQFENASQAVDDRVVSNRTLDQFDDADRCATLQRAASTLKKNDPAILEIDPRKNLNMQSTSNGFGRGKLVVQPSQSVADKHCQGGKSADRELDVSPSLAHQEKPVSSSGFGRGAGAFVHLAANPARKDTANVGTKPSRSGRDPDAQPTPRPPVSTPLSSSGCGRGKLFDSISKGRPRLKPESNEKLSETSRSPTPEKTQMEDPDTGESSKLLTTSHPAVGRVHNAAAGDRFPDSLLASDAECAVPRSVALKDSRGLIFGDGAASVEVADRLGDLSLHSDISNLISRTGLQDLTRPQCLAMPAVLDRRDVILVGPNGSKKTTAVLLPLMSLLVDSARYSVLPPGNGPRCVVVAPTSERVKAIGQLCSKYGGHHVKTITTYGGGLEKERMTELSAGCDVLVTTPRCWLRLMNTSYVTNAVRLCHLVLDRFDVLYELFREEVHRIAGIVRTLVESRIRDGKGRERLGFQTVINCERWTRRVETLTGHMEDWVRRLELPQMLPPLRVFSSFVECAVYCGIKPALHLTSVDRKIDKLQALIVENLGRKIAVACSSVDDVMVARGAVSATNRSTVVAHENMKHDVLNQVPLEWKREKCPVLVFSDGSLLTGITDADVLVHFSLPASKSTFSDRFVTIREAMTKVNPKDDRRTKVYIMAGFQESTSATALPFIVDYLKRLRIAIPQEVEDTLKTLKRNKEASKDEPFCDNLLQTGKCFGEDRCKQRHVFKDTDQAGLTYTQGHVKLSVCHVHSAVKFSVRILEYKEADKWIKCKNDFSSLTSKMSVFFGQHSNRRLHGPITVGDVVAYLKDGATIFHRVRVVQIVEVNWQKQPKVVRVRALDFGYEDTAGDGSLYELPEDLKRYPEQSVTMYLRNLLPIDLDTSWSRNALEMVENAIAAVENEMQPKDETVAQIFFRFGSTLVVNNLTWLKRRTRVTTVALDLRIAILQSNNGLPNQEYSSTMKALLDDAGLDYRRDESSQVPKIEHQDPPSWAHLTRNDFVRAKIFDVESPAHFFVQSLEFRAELISLQQEIGVALGGRGVPLSKPRVGDICVARSSRDGSGESSWNRCLIKLVEGDSATVLFVDFGDVSRVPTDELFPVPWKFVTKLPFQAVECCLAGVKASVFSEDDWCEEAVEEFSGLITEATSSDVLVKALDDDGALRTGGKRYAVVLVTDLGLCVNERFSFGFRTVDDFQIDFAHLRELLDGPNAEHGGFSDSDDDEWDTPQPPTVQFVPPVSSEENGRRPPDLLETNYEEAEIEGMEEWLQALGLIPKTEPTEKKMLEAPPSAHKDDVSPLDEIDGSNQPPCQEPETDRSQEVGDEDPARPPALPQHDLEPLVPHLCPKVSWKQDEESVTLRFMIPCLENYQLRITTSYITLFARVSDQLYHQKVEFFGLVSEMDEEVVGASCLSVRLFKSFPGSEWPRLTFLENSDKRIYFDAGDIEDDDDDDEGLVHQYLKHGERVRNERRSDEDSDDERGAAAATRGVVVPGGYEGNSSDEELFPPSGSHRIRIGLKDDFDLFD